MKDQDYTVSNGSVASTSDGTSVGKVVYTITGVESAGYTGVKTAEFNIVEAAAEFAYDGTAVNFIKADGSQFGMFTPQDGTTIALDGDNVVIHYVPKNTTVYKGFYLNADIRFASTWSEASFFTLADGSISITLPKSYCGKAWPVAPVKNSDGATTGDQYYLAIPSEDKLV